jgi:hypothetical protein
MRYSRLKKNIEIKLGKSRKKGPAASTKAPTVSTPTPAAKKIKPSHGPSKKRKASYETEEEEPNTPTLHETIGSVTIKDEELQEWTVGPRTRGKKIDLKDAFESDSSSGRGLRNQDDGSSDDYEMEDVSDDEEEFDADEAGEDEDDQPVSGRRKGSSQSVNRKMSIAESMTPAFKKSSKAIPRSVPDEYINETISKPERPITPELGFSNRNEITGKGSTLPPTPQSMTVTKQEPADSTSTAPNARRDAAQLSPAARLKKIRHDSPPPSLFDHIENARIQADHNLASLSYQANKNSRSLSDSPKTNGETILPSIEHDDVREDEDANVECKQQF